MNHSSTEVIRRVFDERGRHFVEISPHGDCPKILELRTVAGDYSERFFGKVSLALSPEMAEELGRALLAASAEMKKEIT